MYRTLTTTDYKDFLTENFDADYFLTITYNKKMTHQNLVDLHRKMKRYFYRHFRDFRDERFATMKFQFFIEKNATDTHHTHLLFSLPTKEKKYSFSEVKEIIKEMFYEKFSFIKHYKEIDKFARTKLHQTLDLQKVEKTNRSKNRLYEYNLKQFYRSTDVVDVVNSDVK